MNPRKLICLFAITALCFMAAAIPLLAQEPSWIGRDSSFIVFEAKGAGTGPGATNCFGSCPGTVAENANRWGVVTGYFNGGGASHGFVRDCDGIITEFDVPNQGTTTTVNTVAYAINSEGAITGIFQDSQGIWHGFLRSPQGIFTTFDVSGANAGANQGIVGSGGINDRGQIAGYYQDSNNVYHGFLRNPDGAIVTFDAPNASVEMNMPPQGTVTCLESCLTPEGSITGWYFDSNQAVHGYVRATDGTVTDFDNTNGGTGFFQGTLPGSISATGEIAGGVLDSSNIYHRMVTFEAPLSGDTSGSYQGTFSVGINAIGMVSSYVTDNSNVSHGSIRYPDGHSHNFDVADVTGVGQGTTPQGINEQGIIVGYFTDANNVNHGFIRKP